MKKLAAAAVALALGGCANLPTPRPQTYVVHHSKSQPVIVPAPVSPPDTTKPATFKQRFRQGFGKIKWLHHR